MNPCLHSVWKSKDGARTVTVKGITWTRTADYLWLWEKFKVVEKIRYEDMVAAIARGEWEFVALADY